ncbi:lantibiotic protection ABC transporter ATP-binding subunit [Dolosigranulum savutiense]|uniref:Lantibiotic protection ABC transporter ATP-binding subunit n=1 Tax=Dolosigranulum savutiense TaxID=3110288 RepID=A0AB74U575_9LACT
MTIFLQTQQLSKQFKSQVVLDDISIQVEKGQVYGLLGPNGAGKSTLLKLITRVLMPSSGKILFREELLQQHHLQQMGAIIEGPAIYPNLTARENLEVLTTLLEVDPERIEQVLKQVNLTDTGQKLTKHFSLGMKQRLGIAMALVNEPDLLILDEPTNGLDPLGTQELRTLIRDLTEQGVTIIFSSHILSEVGHVADTIGILNQGQLCYEGANDREQRSLETVFMEVLRQEIDAS